MPLGLVGEDIVVLNEHSLWSGGPFQSPVSDSAIFYLWLLCPANLIYLTQDYIGGNPPGPVYTALPGIRDTIWQTQINNGTQQQAQSVLFSVT